MTLPTFAFDDFVADVANTIEQLVGRGSVVGEITDPSVSHDLRPTTQDLRPPSDPSILDGEKIVWHFPDATARIIDEVR